MNKKTLISLMIFSVLIIGFITFKFFSRSQKLISPISEQSIKISPSKSAPEKLKEYIDPSGFKFSYPDNLNLTKIDSTDQTVYSNLKISTKKNIGSIRINVSESQLKTIDDWFKKEKLSTKPAEIKTIKLADIEGRQFIINNSSITLAFDQGALFNITADFKNDHKYWDEVNNTIIKTFAFTQPETTSDESATSSTNDQENEDVIFEGEEVIE
jgi:hypothetical protein